MGIWRSRWAAIGAAVAVALGAGGLWSVQAADPTGFVGIDPPVRIMDTRIDVGLAGAFTTDVSRNVRVTGSIPIVGADGSPTTGIPIPEGAGGVVLNATLVGPTATGGFLSIRPGSATGIPTTSNLNFTQAGVVVPNNVVVRIPTSGDHAGELNIYFKGAQPGTTAHVLLDVVGYFDGNPLQGPQGEKGDQGPAGPRGFSAWDVMPLSPFLGPDVFTVTGEVIASAHYTNIETRHRHTVMLPGLAPEPLADSDVNFATDGWAETTDDDSDCDGTVEQPTAPPGRVCVYLYDWSLIGSAEVNALTHMTDQGFVIEWIEWEGAIIWPPGPRPDTYVHATWAYTSPRADLPVFDGLG